MTDELRCAVRTEARGDSPTGTATTARTHVLVEMALPWPADLGERPEHRQAAAGGRPRGTHPRRGPLRRHRRR